MDINKSAASKFDLKSGFNLDDEMAERFDELIRRGMDPELSLTIDGIFSYHRSIGETLNDNLSSPADESDDTLIERIVSFVDTYQDVPSVRMMHMLMSTPDGLFSNFFGVKWVRLAYPYVEVGHKTAAAFCCTSSGPDVAEALSHSPWDAFVIRVPEGLLPYTTASGEVIHVTLIRVITTRFGGAFRWHFVVSAGEAELWERGLPPEDFASDKEIPPDDFEKFLFSGPLNSQDQRLSLLCRRIVRGTVLWLLDPTRRADAHRKPGTSPAAKKARAAKQKRGLPAFDQYVITAPVKVDCRDEVTRFARGERSSPNVRSIVRGHHKMQPCGPQRSQRIHKWIEPYWRGGDELPIAVKNHKVG